MCLNSFEIIINTQHKFFFGDHHVASNKSVRLVASFRKYLYLPPNNSLHGLVIYQHIFYKQNKIA